MQQAPLAKQYNVRVAWSDADDAFVARIPTLPYAGGHGDTRDEALAEAEASIQSYLELAEELGKPIRKPASRGIQQEQQQLSALQSESGSTTISDSVVSQIAGVAAQEVEEVQMGATAAVGGFLQSATGSSSSGNYARGVSVEVGEEEVAIDLTIAVEYGVSIPQVTEAARRNVINRVENLVGLRVTEVNITVNDVQFPEERPMLGQQEQVERQARHQEAQQKLRA